MTTLTYHAPPKLRPFADKAAAAWNNVLSDAPSTVRCLVRKEFTQNHASGQGEYLKAHKKYPWFCGECGYPPHDEVKHIQNTEFTPAVFLNTCGCEPMTAEAAEALGAMVKAALSVSENAEVSDGGPLTHESTEARTRRSLH